MIRNVWTDIDGKDIEYFENCDNVIIPAEILEKIGLGEYESKDELIDWLRERRNKWEKVNEKV